MVWYSHLFQNYPQFLVIHTVKGFGIVNKAEIDVFLELSCCLNPADVGNLISGSSAFSKTSFNIWKFTVHPNPYTHAYTHPQTDMLQAFREENQHCVSVDEEKGRKTQSKEMGSSDVVVDRLLTGRP